MIGDKWSAIAYWNVEGGKAASTLFKGKIVVSEGLKNNDDDDELKSVESYDYYKKKWIHLPDMNEKRFHHAAVSMGNKMFVIGGNETSSCEIFDSFSRSFTSLKSFAKLCEIDISLGDLLNLCK